MLAAWFTRRSSTGSRRHRPQAGCPDCAAPATVRRRVLVAPLSTHSHWSPEQALGRRRRLLLQARIPANRVGACAARRGARDVHAVAGKPRKGSCLVVVVHGFSCPVDGPAVGSLVSFFHAVGGAALRAAAGGRSGCCLSPVSALRAAIRCTWLDRGINTGRCAGPGGHRVQAQYGARR